MKTEPEIGVTCLQARVTEDGWQPLGANIGGKEGSFPSLQREHGSYQHLDFELLASRTERQ